MRTLIGILPIVAGTSAADFSPARRISGSLPGLPPPNTIGWVEETVELEVDLNGRVDRATLLTAASRGPSLVVPAVADRRFKPAALVKNRSPRVLGESGSGHSEEIGVHWAADASARATRASRP